MKRIFTLLIFNFLLANCFFSGFQSSAQDTGNIGRTDSSDSGPHGGINNTPFSGDIPDNGDNTLGEVYNKTSCGLNYVLTSVMITTRYSPPGVGLPATLNMTMPPCVGQGGANVAKAFVWWGISYFSGSSTTPSVSLTNPLGNVFTYTGTLSGTSGPKCWGEIGTRTFRADVTSCVNTSGNYSINIIGNTAAEVDGATFVIVYNDPNATFQGTMVINDGCQTFSNGASSTMSVANFTACANSSNGSGFSCTGDQQNNISPPSHQTTVNGTTQTFSNLFWNTDVVNTNVTAGQTSVSFTNSPNPSDCWSWNVIGYYFQTNGCVTCTPSGMISNITSQNAYCGQNNGSASVNPSGGNSPYTYTWNTSPPQYTASASNLGAGTYTCTITDQIGCTAIVTATITQTPALASTTSAVNAGCSGGTNGSASVTASGGTPGYTYLWSPSGGTGATANNLSPATYTVTITDLNGCTITATAVVGANSSPTVSSTVTTSYCPGANQVVNTTFNTTSYTDVTVCASNPSGYVTDNQVCSDPGNVDCAGHFQKDSLVAPYSIMGATLTNASVQSVYVSLDTISGNNSRGCGDDNRLWLRSPGGTLFKLVAQKSSNTNTNNKYKPTFTVAGSLGTIPNASTGSYNLVGYKPDQGSLALAGWIGQSPGATWAGNSNENYTHAAGQWMVYTNDQVGTGGCNPAGNYTKITEFCMTFRTYPTPTYSWSTDVSSSSGCSGYLSSTSISNPTFVLPSTNYNCTYNLVVTESSGCTATTSINVNCNTLPVGLLSYTGKNTAFGNKLEWITSSEINNHHFTIQRSTDGTLFTDFKTVLSQAVNGNSSQSLYYSLTDEDVKPGNYYYKLKQTDINGDYKELGTVAIVVKPDREIFNVKPNPTTGIAEVTYECQSDEISFLKVYNDKGMLQMSMEIACRKGENIVPIDLSTKPDGIYLISVTTGDNVHNAKLILRRNK